MTETFDLVVIGAGTAAMVAAHKTSAAGWKVAVVDFRPYGGTCALRGCDPKKILITGAQVMDDIRRMKSNGVVAAESRIEWRDLMAFKRTFTDPVPDKQEKRYRENGIATFHGRARFTSPSSLVIDGHGSVEARHVLIAAGARPVPLGISGEEYVITNEEFLSLEALPRRIVLVGGGYIAAEFSQIATRAGAKVTILQRGRRMLPQFEPELVDWLMESFGDVGTYVRTGHEVTSIEKTAAGFVVRARSNDQRDVTLDADLVVHAAGRVPDLSDLDLDAARVERDERGRLKLNEFLQSVSNPAVYAAGDAASVGPPLTPVSSHDAKVVARNLLEGNKYRPDYRGVPSVAFTIPPIAAVGMSEAEARKLPVKLRVNTQNATDWYTARRVAEKVYGFKVLVDDESDLVLGAHLVGPHVDEVINLFALAIRHGLTTEQLKTTMFAYPTGASDIGYML